MLQSPEAAAIKSLFKGTLGERRQYYKPRGILFQSSKRGAGGRTLCAPSPLPPVSPHPEGGNSDDKITAGLGRNRIGAGGVGVVLGVLPPPDPNPSPTRRLNRPSLPRSPGSSF